MSERWQPKRKICDSIFVYIYNIPFFHIRDPILVFGVLLNLGILEELTLGI